MGQDAAIVGFVLVVLQKFDLKGRMFSFGPSRRLKASDQRKVLSLV